MQYCNSVVNGQLACLCFVALAAAAGDNNLIVLQQHVVKAVF